LEVDDLGDRINPDFLQNSVIVDIDFSDTQIVITAVNQQPVAHRELLLVRVVGGEALQLRSSLNPATNWPGFTTQPGRFQISGQGEMLSFQLTGVTAAPGQQIVVDVVPEPPGLGLLASASGGLVASRRRRFSLR
jgi:hypothetical protein